MDRKGEQMKKAINASNAPEAIGPYSHANVSGNLVFVSGQLPIDDNGQLVLEDPGKACKACMKNIQKILVAAGSSLEQVVKCTIYLTNLADFGAVNEAYGSFFEKDYPSRVCVQVSALPKGATCEIDAIASLKD